MNIMISCLLNIGRRNPSRKEKETQHMSNLPNQEEVKRQREKLEYISAINSREWLREAESMDQVIQLYPELKSLS
jgi:hypothetical protein